MKIRFVRAVRDGDAVRQELVVERDLPALNTDELRQKARGLAAELGLTPQTMGFTTTGELLVMVGGPEAAPAPATTGWVFRGSLQKPPDR